jgi:hypothetical protein
MCVTVKFFYREKWAGGGGKSLNVFSCLDPINKFQQDAFIFWNKIQIKFVPT